MTPFEPKGDVAEWRLVYDHLKDLERGSVVTIESIEELLGRPLGQNRSPVYRAIRELEENNSRTIATVRGIGYRIADPNEHLGLGLSHSGRARRQLRRGLQRAESADRGGLAPAAAARLEAFEATTSRLVEFLGRMSKAVDQQGERIENLAQDTQETSERVKAVEEALRRHGLT